MANLSPAQKIYTTALLTAICIWLFLKFGVPAYEYAYGKNPRTILLEQLTPAMGYVVLAILALAWVLQRIGVLPTVPANAGSPTVPVGMARLRNLVLWIVIALLLVFLFNLFQGSKDNPHDRTTAALVNYVPLLLLAGVWIFFLIRMYTKKNRGPDGGGG